MNTFLKDLALAHMNHEGFYKGSRSQRNNNPGNLRDGPPQDGDGFTIFKDFNTGFAALEYDVKTKICGGSKHIDYSKSPTFLTYVKVYAPTDDGNSPDSYCLALCSQLTRYNVKPTTPLTILAQLINQQIDIVPDPVKVQPVVPPEIRVAQLERRAANEKNPSLKQLILNVLNRLIARLKS